MSAKTSTSTKFTIGCVSWPGIVMSIAIIAVRAFQPDAAPVESWSTVSWALMLLPAFLAPALWLAAGAIGLVLILLEAAFAKGHK